MLTCLRWDKKLRHPNLPAVPDYPNSSSIHLRLLLSTAPGQVLGNRKQQKTQTAERERPTEREREGGALSSRCPSSTAPGKECADHSESIRRSLQLLHAFSIS
ncbi:hypothetical protein QQF64_025621 [Cirrhinus molitorella]|uniref:Uncharacterized protein n=1 Tax=Cirrhinus molitorella TaxID=172907 RepID=A0ABR3NQL1_9TELE